MRKRLILGLFIGTAIIQIAISLSMIARREAVLHSGEQFKFKVAPVDPYDAFRGRYVALRIKENEALVHAGVRLDFGKRVFAQIMVDEEGFARFSEVSTVRPHGLAYIEAKVINPGRGSNTKARLDLPIDRYYMEEKKAPLAERVYQRHARQGKEDAYVLVRIKDGFAVIEALYVGGRRIEEVVRGYQSGRRDK